MGASAEAALPQRLAQTIEEYLADHPAAALLEDGRVLFDMRSAHYAVTESARTLPAAVLERRAQPDADAWWAPRSGRSACG